MVVDEYGWVPADDDSIDDEDGFHDASPRTVMNKFLESDDWSVEDSDNSGPDWNYGDDDDDGFDFDAHWYRDGNEYGDYYDPWYDEAYPIVENDPFFIGPKRSSEGYKKWWNNCHVCEHISDSGVTFFDHSFYIPTRSYAIYTSCDSCLPYAISYTSAYNVGLSRREPFRHPCTLYD
jgi:hypothetical protein